MICNSIKSIYTLKLIVLYVNKAGGKKHLPSPPPSPALPPQKWISKPLLLGGEPLQLYLFSHLWVIYPGVWVLTIPHFCPSYSFCCGSFLFLKKFMMMISAYFFFFFWPCSEWDLSSLTRDGIHIPCVKSVES